MTIGAWTPESGVKNKQLDQQFLHRCVTIANSEALNRLDETLSEQEKSDASIMHAEQELWNTALADFDNDQLIGLIRFFTIAEMQLSGWQAGSESPVIAINQLLKSRGTKLDKDMLLWIRQNSSNRFIPNGAIL